MDISSLKRKYLFLIAGISLVIASSDFAAQPYTNINVSAKHHNNKVTKHQVIQHQAHTKQGQLKQPPAKSSGLSMPLVVAKQPYEVTLHGYINEVAWWANDGDRNRVFYGNNTFMDSRFKISIIPVVPKQPVSFFSNVEIAVRNNASNAVSQRVQSINSLFIRIAEVGLDLAKFGKIYLGLGSTASDYTAESDLSGTYGFIVDSGVQKLGGGLFFNNATTNSIVGSPTVNNTFDNLDGLSRQGRLRYDTPTVAGLRLETSLIERNQRDISLKFLREFKLATVMASMAYANSNLLIAQVPGNTIDGSGSIRLNNGLNFSVAGGEISGTPPGRSTPYYFYLKPGYRANLNNYGKTDFVLDYGRYNNFALSEDQGRTFGFAVSQNIDNWDAAVYAGYRLFKLKRVGTKFDNINIVAVGGVIKY